ncbi:hypothetical protein GALMADRAFT_923492 [Galerina marginata CBS 339.88]|uniref:Peptidase metallopeptidase domain-containing protein n=1 Tax=Galerina marginata (strain CBS 339.88) TaxID=685588 RepID=A0A067SGM6_GALM3|nr:hypothetical protein GALMADRAFT_923492 [Galerina marginata CBS 339.88]
MTSVRSFFLVCWLVVTLSTLPTRAWLNDTVSPIYPNKTTAVLEISDNFYGVRNVSYWVTDDGLAVIDGDVIYGTLEDLVAHNHTGQPPTNMTRRAHSIFRNENPWASATITYNFNSAATQRLLGSIVSGAIANWKATAPYLDFKQVANSATGQNGVLTIKAPSCGGGCNSPIGFFNSPMTMNLQQNCPGSGTCGIVQATHEFGHALGLIHEHQRPDREKLVHYNCANLTPTCNNMPAGKTCCSSGIPAGCCTLASNFNVLSGFEDDATGAYDIKSIMQYVASAFALPGTNTLTSNAPGVVVPVSAPNAITTTDSNRMCKIYSGQCAKARSCTLSGCPSKCVPVKRCNKIGICGQRPPPPCCFPVSVQTCNSKRAACTKKGCDFLKN